MLIDSHAHGMWANKDAFGKYVPPLSIVWNPAEISKEDYLKKSREIGVEKVVLLDPPDITFKLRDIFGEYVIPVPMVDLDEVSPEYINNLFEQGANGIKFISPTKPYGDDAYLPIYDVVRQNKGVAVFHTGYLVVGLFEPGCIEARKSIVDITHMRPASLDRIARAFPDLKILMAHFGNPWWEEAWKMLSSHKNIYADFSGGTAYKRSLNIWSEIFMPNGRLDIEAVSKLCFGTDFEYFTKDICIKPMQDFYEAFFDKLKLTDEIKQKIYKKNILSITDLT